MGWLRGTVEPRPESARLVGLHAELFPVLHILSLLHNWHLPEGGGQVSLLCAPVPLFTTWYQTLHLTNALWLPS